MCLTIKDQHNHLKHYQFNSVIEIYIEKTIILTVLVLLKLIETRKFYYPCLNQAKILYDTVVPAHASLPHHRQASPNGLATVHSSKT